MAVPQTNHVNRLCMQYTSTHQKNAAQRARSRQDRAERDFKTSNTGGNYTKEWDYCVNKPHWEKEHCPAKGKKCIKCGKFNHFAWACKTAKRKAVHVVSDNQVSDKEADELFINAVTQTEIFRSWRSFCRLLARWTRHKAQVQIRLLGTDQHKSLKYFLKYLKKYHCLKIECKPQLQCTHTYCQDMEASHSR